MAQTKPVRMGYFSGSTDQYWIWNLTFAHFFLSWKTKDEWKTLVQNWIPEPEGTSKVCQVWAANTVASFRHPGQRSAGSPFVETELQANVLFTEHVAPNHQACGAEKPKCFSFMLTWRLTIPLVCLWSSAQPNSAGSLVLFACSLLMKWNKHVGNQGGHQLFWSTGPMIPEFPFYCWWITDMAIGSLRWDFFSCVN